MTLKNLRTFELTIPSTIDAMDNVHDLLVDMAQTYGLSEDMAFWMELAVSESVINAIRHGNNSDPSKKTGLRITCNGKAIEVTVKDQGKGFKLDDIVDPRDSENILKPSGRGILIIRSFMDELYLTVQPGLGSQLRMVKKIPRTAS